MKKQLYFVYTLIISVFIVYLIANTIRLINIHENNGYSYNIESIYSTISTYGVFRILPVFLIPVIAVFYKNKISWMVILVYLYLSIWQIISFVLDTSILEDSVGLYAIVVFTILLLIPIFSIYVMNKSAVFSVTYSLNKKHIMRNNLIALIIGCFISLNLVIINNSRYYEGLHF